MYEKIDRTKSKHWAKQKRIGKTNKCGGGRGIEYIKEMGVCGMSSSIEA
jgi:hypothetical protein